MFYRVRYRVALLVLIILLLSLVKTEVNGHTQFDYEFSLLWKNSIISFSICHLMNLNVADNNFSQKINSIKHYNYWSKFLRADVECALQYEDAED